MMQYIGMRTLKTGLTVFLAGLVAQAINPQDQFVLLFTAVIALESSVASSFEIGMKRVAATIIGAFSAILLYSSGLPLPVSAALSVMLLIIVANRLGQTGSIGISGSVTILILLNGYAGQNPYFFTYIRLRDTILAVALALIVNLLIFPPRAAKRIRRQEQLLYDNTLAMVEKIYLYRVADNLEDYRSEVQQLASDVQTAATELGIVKSIEDKRLAVYKKLLSTYQKIYIYSENLALMGKDMRVTDANQKQLTDLFGHEEVLEAEWNEEDITRNEVIYNYTLDRLISNLKEIKAYEQQLSELPAKNR
ncbi:Aromatic acid exporter family member 1 [anaerobic digester metagenome]